MLWYFSVYWSERGGKESVFPSPGELITFVVGSAIGLVAALLILIEVILAIIVFVRKARE